VAPLILAAGTKMPIAHIGTALFLAIAVAMLNVSAMYVIIVTRTSSWRMPQNVNFAPASRAGPSFTWTWLDTR